MNGSIRTYWGQRGLGQLLPAWNILLESVSSATLHQHPEWYRAYVEHLEKQPDEVVFCAIELEGRMAGILPLKLARRNVGGVGFRRMDLPACDHLHLGDVVVADWARPALTADTVYGLLRECGELRWDLACFRHVMAGSTAHALLEHSSERTLIRWEKGCYMFNVRPYERVRASLSKKFKSNLRNAHNRIERLGAMSYVVGSEGAELQRAFGEFVDLEASGWKGAEGSGTAIKLDPRTRAFYEGLVNGFASSAQCEIHVLRAGDVPLAAMFSLVCGDTSYMLKVGYDQQHARLSPVHLLMERIFMRHGENSRIRTINMISDARWLEPWEPRRVDVFNVFLFNRTIRGVAAQMAAWMGGRKGEKSDGPADSAHRNEAA